jgi:hypothetical protein
MQEPDEDNAPEFTLETMLFPNPAEKNCPIDEPHIIIFADDTSGNVYAMSMLKDIKPKQFSYVELQRFIKERWILKGKFIVPQYMKVPDSFISEDNQTLFSESQVQALVKTKYIKRKLELIIT